MAGDVRTLVVSDIHGNWAALKAVLAQPHDTVICLGDLVGYGPEPAACVAWARSSGAIVVQGNHDRAASGAVPPRCRSEFEWLASAVTPLTRAQLGAADFRFLNDLPRWASVSVPGQLSLCVHATPSDPLYRYLGPEQPAWQHELVGVTEPLVLVGHTHLQFDLAVDGHRVVNPGSVGQPKDGDPRAAYAVVTDGELLLAHVAYDVERTVRGLEAGGVAPAAVEALGTLLRTGRAPGRR